MLIDREENNVSETPTDPMLREAHIDNIEYCINDIINTCTSEKEIREFYRNLVVASYRAADKLEMFESKIK